MNKVCVGCGCILQSLDKSKEGYISASVYEKASLCERCFKIKNYAEVYVSNNSINQDKLIDSINASKKSIVYLVDCLTLSKEVLSVIDRFSNKVYVVLTKRDLLPKSVKDEKLINYVRKKTLIKDVFVISAYKNIGVKLLYNELLKNKESSVYVCGYTSSGKSTLINKLLTLNEKSEVITTSSLPNTTLEVMNIKLNDKLEVIDTPGFSSERELFNYIDMNKYKSLIVKKCVKPKVYNLRSGFMIILDSILRIENNSLNDVNLVFYFKNEIVLKKMKCVTNDVLKDKDMIDLNLNNEDIVVSSLGFIKVVGKGYLRLYCIDKRVISKRDKLV